MTPQVIDFLDVVSGISVPVALAGGTLAYNALRRSFERVHRRIDALEAEVRAMNGRRLDRMEAQGDRNRDRLEGSP